MQEYLETIYRLEEDRLPAKTGEVAKHLAVAPASVTDMLQRLERAGLVTYEPYKGAVLTDEGRRLARQVLARHRIMQAFLQEVCGMEHREAHDAACDMEHTIPKPLHDWMEAYLEERLGRKFDTNRKVREQIGA